MPVDVGGMIMLGLGVLWLYAVGIFLLGCLVVISFRRQGFSRVYVALFFVLLCAFILSPFIYVSYLDRSKEQARKENEQARKEEEVIYQYGLARNKEAFAGYCKGRERTVRRIPRQHTRLTLTVRLDPQFRSGDFDDVHAGKVVEHFKGRSGIRPEICEHSELRYIAGKYSGKYIKGKGYEQEFRRYWLCRQREPDILSSISSQYELVIGKPSPETPAPWRPDRYYFSSAPVKIMDVRSGDVLAEDTIYGFHGYKGGDVCPNAMVQLEELIVDVFGDQGHG